MMCGFRWWVWKLGSTFTIQRLQRTQSLTQVPYIDKDVDVHVVTGDMLAQFINRVVGIPVDQQRQVLTVQDYAEDEVAKTPGGIQAACRP